MFTPVIVGPVLLPETPEPSVSECQTMLTYANGLIKSLKKVSENLDAASTSPDEGLLAIREFVSTMLEDAEGIRNKLNTIKTEATNKSNLASQNSVIY